MTTKCGEFVIPKEHLAPCHTCNSKGWDCKRQSKGGKGIDGYDFILYVTAINTKQCGDTIGRKFQFFPHNEYKRFIKRAYIYRWVFPNYALFLGGNDAATVAYAAHCQQEKALDRPIAGHTNICPNSIVDGEKEIAMLTSTVKHELLHALGFSLR